MNTECLVATLPSATEDQRLAVFFIRLADGSSQISLRQQSWAKGLGWYDQKTLEVEPEQLRLLRTVFGMGGGGARRPVAEEGPGTLPFPSLARTESA